MTAPKTALDFMLEPDPREEKLPLWVRENILKMRNQLRKQAETLAIAKGENPDTNVRLVGKHNYEALPLPKHAHVAFRSKWGEIQVGHALDGTVRIQGDSVLIAHLQAGNALTVELKDN